ncbi:hypothetical protein AAVH_11836 [Aphelenchoides avenae]|nr:hypothetical protein AAVH_32583 [Aphelenchus avenae]KAH7720783.1 hypothetical protein AAVH_11836 [Aphelenchus avenae]
MQERPPTIVATIESTKQSITNTDHASAGSQSTPDKLPSVSTSASRTSSEPSPSTPGPSEKSDKVTLTNASTESGGTKSPPETATTAANADKTNTTAASDRTFTASTSTTNQTEGATTDMSLASSTSVETASPIPYVWIAVLAVGVVGTLVSTVLFVLAFRGIICAPKQSPGNYVISKELDKTLL